MQQWLLQSHFDDGPHWPRLIPRFCQSSWINQIEPGETQNQILSGQCQQWPSQSTLIYMDFICEAAHGVCFMTIWQDMKIGCKISETRLNHSHGCQSHTWCKIWDQCMHISIPEGESWFWLHADNTAVAPSKPFWRWPTLTKTESTVLPIIMNQSNGTWRNTESKFCVENANNGHLRAHWFTWISPVRQLTELVSGQFGKTWRQDAKFLKPGWIIPMGVRVMHDANLKPTQAHFNPGRRVLVLAAHWQCSSGSFKAILKMAHIDQDWVHGFANHHESIKWNLEKHRIKFLSGECQQWPSQSTLIYMDFTCEAAHGACFTTIRQDMKTGCKISETRLNHSHGCQSHAWCKIWNQHKHISIPEGESWFWPHTDNAAVAPSKPFWRWPTLTKTESTVLPIIMNQSNITWRNTESKFWVENANNGHHRAHWFTWISPVRQLTALVSRQFGKTWRQDAKFLKSGWIIPMGVRVMHDAKFETNASTFQSRKESLDFGRMLTMQQWLLQSHFEDGPHWPRLSPQVLPIIMNQSNRTWRNTESKFWVENANNGHLRAHWFTWISPVRQLTELVSRQFGKTWRQDAKFLKPGWIIPMGVRVMHDAKFETNTSTFQSQKESLGFGRTLTMQQWLLQSHFEDGPHWPRLSPRFCQSSWINHMEPGETQNQNFEWRMPTMAITEHIDLHGFHLWGSSRSLFHDNSARHEDRMQNFWNQVESFPWVSESCMMQNFKPTQAHFNPGRRVLVLAACW